MQIKKWCKLTRGITANEHKLRSGVKARGVKAKRHKTNEQKTRAWCTNNYMSGFLQSL